MTLPAPLFLAENYRIEAALAARMPPIMAIVLSEQFAGFSAEEVGFLKSLLRKPTHGNMPARAAPPGSRQSTLQRH